MEKIVSSEKRKFVRRIEISIPYNENTVKHYDNLGERIVSYFNGATLIRCSDGGLWYNHDESRNYKEDTYLFVIYYDPIEFSKKKISPEQFITQLGEEIISYGEIRSIALEIEANWHNFTQIQDN